MWSHRSTLMSGTCQFFLRSEEFFTILVDTERWLFHCSRFLLCWRELHCCRPWLFCTSASTPGLRTVSCVKWAVENWVTDRSCGYCFLIWYFCKPCHTCLQVTTVMYLKVSISDFLTLFSARTNDNFFWGSMPSPILLGAAGLSLTLSTILACTWPESQVRWAVLYACREWDRKYLS